MCQNVNLTELGPMFQDASNMNQARKNKYPEYVRGYPVIVHSISPGECVSSTVYSVPIFGRFVHLMELGTLILSAKEISGKQEMDVEREPVAQDPLEEPEIVLQKQLVAVVVEEEKTETETETMVTENNRHPLLPDQPDRPPTTEGRKALVKTPPDPTVGIKTITTAKIMAVINDGLNNSPPDQPDRPDRPLITEGLRPRPLQITVGLKTITTEITEITADPHKIA